MESLWDWGGSETETSRSKSIRCWLFGHDYLHLDTHFVDGDRLASSHLCDRCDEERTIVLGVGYLTDSDDTEVEPQEVDT